MAQTLDVETSPKGDDGVDVALTAAEIEASEQEGSASRWRRWGAAFLKAMRPDGTAVWRHPPRGA